MYASRSGPTPLLLPQGRASSPECGLANTAFLFQGLQTPSPEYSLAKGIAVGAAAIFPPENDPVASIGVSLAFLHRQAVHRHKTDGSQSATRPNRRRSTVDRVFLPLEVPSTWRQCTWFETVRGCIPIVG